LTRYCAVLAVLIGAASANADKGPKPYLTVVIRFEDPKAQKKLLSAELLECSSAACADAKPMKEAGPQRVEVQANSVFAMSYGFQPYCRWRLKFEDGERLSDPFPITSFRQHQVATIARGRITLGKDEGGVLYDVENRAWQEEVRKLYEPDDTGRPAAEVLGKITDPSVTTKIIDGKAYGFEVRVSTERPSTVRIPWGRTKDYGERPASSDWRTDHRLIVPAGPGTWHYGVEVCARIAKSSRVEPCVKFPDATATMPPPPPVTQVFPCDALVSVSDAGQTTDGSAFVWKLNFKSRPSLLMMAATSESRGAEKLASAAVALMACRGTRRQIIAKESRQFSPLDTTTGPHTGWASFYPMVSQDY
jgi:hypothetical protein